MNNASIAEFKRQSKIQRLFETLRVAEVRCLTSTELLARVMSIWNDPLSNEIISCLKELDLSLAEKRELAHKIRELSIFGDSLPSRDKPKADKKLGQLLEVLADADALEIAIGFLDHRRKPRRTAGCTALKRLQMTPEVAIKVVQRYQRTRDEDLAEAVIRNPQVIPGVDYRLLLEHSNDSYWRMRIFEALIPTKYHEAISLSKHYPFEFVYAVGRLKHRPSLPIIRQLFEENKSDLDFLSIFTWTLGKLRVSDDFGEIRVILDKLTQ